jgi:hypothetical protein
VSVQASDAAPPDQTDAADPAHADRRDGPKAVAIALYKAFSGLLIPVARELARRHGTAVHFYVRTETERRGFQHLLEDGVAASLTVIPGLRDPSEYDRASPDDVIRHSRTYEQRIGRPLMRLTFTHRFLGRGFNVGGYNYPRSIAFNRDVDDVEQMRYYCKLLQFWETELTDKAIDWTIQLPLEGIVVGQMLGLPHRRLDASRFGSYWLWTDDEFHRNAGVVERYRQGGAERVRLDQAYSGFGSAAFFGKRHALHVLWKMIKYTGVWFRRRRLQDMRLTIRYWDNIKVHFSEVRTRRRLRRDFYHRAHDLDGRDVFYIPLHKEPETGLQMMSPEFFHQHAIILAMAASLPAGALLAVKENNKTIGRRHFSFYEQVADLKNVRFIDDREPSIELIRRAKATITVTGTAGLEAATQGKPVLTFGRHNMYNELPHVLEVTDFADIPGLVDRVMSGEFDEEACRADAERFLGAVKEWSFDADGVWISGAFHEEPTERKGVAKAAVDLLESSLQTRAQRRA